MTVEEIVSGIEARGVVLNSPALENTLCVIESKVKFKIDHTFSDLYKIFNGYNSHDNKNHINMWSVEQIVDNLPNLYIDNEGVNFAFADVLLDSDFLVANFSNASCPVFLLYERREVAPDFPTFLKKLVRGAFDM